MRLAEIQRAALRATAAAFALVGAGAVSFAEQPIPVADPGTLEEGAQRPLCCGVPQRDEVTADHVFGRWVVLRAPLGIPMKAGELVEFHGDGKLATAHGACRFAVLRAELSVSCTDHKQIGEVRFEDDTRLIWRHEGREAIFIAPAD